MTDWDAIAETGKEPDTLEKVIEDIEGALLPMMKAMPKRPTFEQIELLLDGVQSIVWRTHHVMPHRTIEWADGKVIKDVQYADAV